MGRSMAAMVVTERHLWVNLADIGKKEKGFLLDAPVSPSELFGTSSRRWSRSLGRRRRAQRPSNPSFLEGPGLSPNNAGVLTHLRLRIRDGHRGLVSRPVPLPRLRVGLDGGAGQREVDKTWGRWSRRSVRNALVRTRVSETSTPFPRGGGGGGGGTVNIGPHLPLSKFPCNHGLQPGLGGNLDSALETHYSLYAGLMMFWLSSMFHRNYLTDGPDSTLRTSPPGLVSCAETMDGDLTRRY